ncbi:hypothetical protein BDM02DRAFT_3189660 [Thelephora ganbajun]|uniref:Uncharacterized protein n=1 Tax=Thelephora ganbajun TaxID=370292 RepID=A0ACB6Z848_THEGA|nr:hypothetical protein BDM02DRAFT_3189660 [Thelephora ganbajun]
MVTKQPPEAPPELISEDDHTGKNAHDTVQSGWSRVVERTRKGMTLGAAAIHVNVSKGPAGGFDLLKAVLGAISAVYTNYKETAAVRNKIEDLLSRIVALEEHFYSRPDDVEEQRRRSELIRHVVIPPSDSTTKRFPGSSKNIRETIFDYQMAQQVAMYEQARKLINPAEASVLNNFRCAQGVEYRHGNRTGCLKGTRTAVLDQIEVWTRGFDKPPVYWLNGLAGTGKSTIAQRIAERIFADGQLGASFFCSRDFEDRRNLHFIFPTLAVQLARRYTDFRSIFVRLVQSDPTIAYESLYSQMKKLIVEPLERSAISTVIVIDALDECKDEEPASAILSVLGQFVSKIPKVRFFLTGRPEPRIRKGFGLPLLAEATDVRNFLGIADRQGGLDGWPTKEQLDLLRERAAGLFVYAVATVKFVDHKNNNPKKQLDRPLLLPKNTAYEGMTRFKPNTTLDSLYTSVLQEAFGDDYPEDDPKVRSVLGAVILAANPLSPSAIGTLLGFDTEDVFPLLSSIHSVLTLQEDTDQPVRPFHKSFPDFIVDPTRCINKRFRVSPTSHHPELLVGCLDLMNRTLEKNMCKLPDAVTNSEVPDLRERIDRYIDSALQYACKSWHKHLVDEHTVQTPEITSALHRFLENKFVFWLEVLSVLGAAREAIDALDLITKCLEAPPTIELANDCFRFVTGLFEVIEESVPHIYHSALPLSPQMSTVRKLYGRHANPMTRIVHGLPISWDPAIVTMEYHCIAAGWSPCGRFIAISNGRSTAEIRDAATLKRLTILESLGGQIRTLVFSPDARLLMSYTCSPEKLIIWDLQTGVLISAVSAEQWDRRTDFPITYSARETMFGALISRHDTSIIRIYNVHSGTHIYSHPVEGEVVDDIWTHVGCLRFATIKPGFITVWEVGFASTNAPREFESLPLPANLSHDLCPQSFHPTLSRLAFSHSERIFVWDARHSKFLLDEHAERLYTTSFSSDGRFFVYGTMVSGIYLWKESPTHYILHRKLNREIEMDNLLMSPNGRSILVFGGMAIQLSHTMDPSTSLPGKQGHRGFNVEFSSDETLATVTRVRGNTITVLDLKSGDPLLTIDTGMHVYGQRATGNTVVSFDGVKVVTWNLPARDRGLNPKVNAKDSIRTTMTRCPGMDFLESASLSPDLHRVAITVMDSFHLHDVSTGQCLASVPTHWGRFRRPWFTSDGRQVFIEGEVNGFTIVEDSRSGVIKLEHLGPTNQPPSTPPWLSSRGYQITDGWILGISGKRLLRLPPHWQSLDTTYRRWSGRFLALLYHQLPEAVILELEE